MRRQRVHEQEYVEALIAEILGNGGGRPGRADAQDRRIIGGGDDDDRAAQALFAQGMLQEILDLAAALADQGDDRRYPPRYSWQSWT